MSENEFITNVNELGISINNDILSKLNKYYEILINWNNKINLTRIIDKKDVYLKHFYDSLTLIKAIDLNKELYVCDIGTGAGFPGLVLKIVFPNLKITLVDALNKRVDFLKEVIKELKLKDIEVFHERAEDYIRNNKDKFDLITCRAVSRLNIISEICLPGVKIKGYFIPMKANIDSEIQNTKYLEVLSSKIEKIITFNLPYENSVRNLIVIKKLGKIDNKYPRSYDKIIKKEI